MADRRFFLLPEPIQPTEIDSFLCRVVTLKTAPLEKFAPVSLPGAPAHTTRDIIPSILPEPILSTSCNEFFSVVRKQGISAKLSALLKINVSRDEEQSRRLESQSVRRYTLPNPDAYFRELMKNEHYAKDVRELLESVWPHHAFLVTGFLTATESSWTIKTINKRTKAFDMTVPVAEAAGFLVSGLADVGLGLTTSTAAQQSREITVAKEEIFAVSYSTVTLSYMFGSPAGFIARVPAVGRPKRAKPHHLAMGQDDDEEIEYDSDEEGNVGKISSQGFPVVHQYSNQTITLDHQQILAEADEQLVIDLD